VSIAVALAALLGWAGKLQLDTPQSLSIEPAVALFHAPFFAWGWSVHARPEALAACGRRAFWYLAAAAAVSPLVLRALGGGAPPPLSAIAASAAFTSFTTAAFIGLCLRYATGHRPWLRPAAGGSYWCYLVHLPLVAALQLALADRPWPAAIKYAAVVGPALLACAVSYLLGVRRTWLARFVG
jgi:hypothetical protein